MYNLFQKCISDLMEVCDSETFVKIMGSGANQLHNYIEKAWNIRNDQSYTI